jgi:uncharacterized membrane protein YqjE
VTALDHFAERVLVLAFSAFEPRTSVVRKVAGTIVLVPLGAIYCAGMLYQAIWKEGERG